MAAGNNPGERERRRLAATQLTGKRYRTSTPRSEVHLDMRANPKLTLRNLVRSPEAYEQHAGCAECNDILAADGRDEPLMTDEQWERFRAHRG